MNAFLNQFNIFRKKSNPVAVEELKKSEEIIRPLNFDDYIGQDFIKNQAKLNIQVAKHHKTAFCHTLLLGPSGAGKTTFAKIIANQMNVPFYEYLGSNLNDFNVLCPLLDKLEEGAILFIDEIHMLKGHVQEFLYPVLEDSVVLYGNLDKPHKINKFTVIGCTTHSGMLNHPFMERFAWRPTMAPYSKQELSIVIKNLANRKYNIDLKDEIALSLASLCQGTPRKAVHLIQTMINIASCTQNNSLNPDLDFDVLTLTCQSLNIDPILGLDRPYREYLNVLHNEKGKPIGAKTLATMCNQQEITLINTIEPFLLMPNTEVPINDEDTLVGPLAKVTRGGRVSTQSTFAYLQACKNLQENHGWFPGETFSVAI